MLTENIAKVPLNGSTTTCGTGCSSQRCTACRRAVGGLYQIFNRIGPITEHLGTALVTGLQLDFVLKITNLGDWISVHPQVLYTVTPVLQQL